MSLRYGQRWWGEDGGVLHSFKSLVDRKGKTVIRVHGSAACLWNPKGGVRAAPEALLDEDLCQACLNIAYRKPCDTCARTGLVEACPTHPGMSCPCPATNVDCPDCDGRGTVDLSEKEIAVLEGDVQLHAVPRAAP